MAVSIGGESRQLRGLNRRHRMRVLAPVQAQDTSNPFNPCGLPGDSAAILSEYRHVQTVGIDRQAAAYVSRYTCLQRLPVVFGNYQYRAHAATSVHQAAFAQHSHQGRDVFHHNAFLALRGRLV